MTASSGRTDSDADADGCVGGGVGDVVVDVSGSERDSDWKLRDGVSTGDEEPDDDDAAASCAVAVFFKIKNEITKTSSSVAVSSPRFSLRNGRWEEEEEEEEGAWPSSIRSELGLVKNESGVVKTGKQRRERNGRRRKKKQKRERERERERERGLSERGRKKKGKSTGKGLWKPRGSTGADRGLCSRNDCKPIISFVKETKRGVGYGENISLGETSRGKKKKGIRKNVTARTKKKKISKRKPIKN